MKVSETKVRQLKITEIDGLDPITVTLEDYEPRKGQITIRCYDRAWTSYWGGMGERTIAEFFCSCDRHYLAKNLDPGIQADVVDEDSLVSHVRRQIIEDRRDDLLTEYKARELYDEASWRLHEGIAGSGDYLQEVLGDDWHLDLPEKPNPKYEYLCQIIVAVQAGLKQASGTEAKEPVFIVDHVGTSYGSGAEHPTVVVGHNADIAALTKGTKLYLED